MAWHRIFTSSSSRCHRCRHTATHTKSKVCVYADVNLFHFYYDAKDSTVTFPLVQRHIRRYRLMDFYFYHCHVLLLTLSLSLAVTLILIFNWKLLNASDSMAFHWMEYSRLIIKKSDEKKRFKKKEKRYEIWLQALAA